jgi:phage terminase small subunit
MLTPKQTAFCEFYAQSGNLTDAAQKAGYSSPNKQGSEQLTKPHVRAYYDSLMSEVKNQRIMDAIERQEILTEIARNDEQQAKDRIKAIDQLSKIQGDYVQKHQVEISTVDKEHRDAIVYAALADR